MFTKNQIYTVVALLLIGGAIAYLYFRGKQPPRVKVDKKDIPNDWQPDAVGQQLFGLIDGVDWFYQNTDEIYTIIMTLTNGQLAALYNWYNAKFNTDLLKDLNDEHLSNTQLSAINNKFQQIL